MTLVNRFGHQARQFLTWDDNICSRHPWRSPEREDNTLHESKGIKEENRMVKSCPCDRKERVLKLQIWLQTLAVIISGLCMGLHLV